jgi:hypothetical protein
MTKIWRSGAKIELKNVRTRTYFGDDEWSLYIFFQRLTLQEHLRSAANVIILVVTEISGIKVLLVLLVVEDQFRKV